MANVTAAEFLTAQRQLFGEIRRRMLAAVKQLSDADLAWRPNEQSNSMANLVVHVCGNLTQRYVAQLGGAPDVRDRDAEFRLDVRRTGEELQWMIDSTFDAVDEILAGLPHERLFESTQIRERKVSVLSLVNRTCAHASEHLGQMLYIGKMRLGPQWKSGE